jgi:hypothetical protein
MKMRREWWEKGYATTLLMTFLIIFFLIGITISVKIGAKYCIATQAQCYADALADAVACMSSGRQGFDERVGRATFDDMVQCCANKFKYPVSFSLKMNNDNVWVTCTYEYPWMAAGPSNSVFDFASKYPKGTKKSTVAFVPNGNENILNYDVAIPSSVMQQLTVGSGEDSDAFRGISVGNKVYKDTIRRLGEQLTSQDVGRYSYNGVQDTWCGTASGQTLFTNDIVYLLGASSYTTYDSSNINDVNAFADEYNWGWNGSASYENGQYHPSIADKKLTTLSYGGNEYIVMSLNIGARTASVLTPDGEKTLTASSLEDLSFKVYDRDVSWK